MAYYAPRYWVTRAELALLYPPKESPMKERTPPIPMKMVESSYMEAYGYDAASQTLAVRFPPRGAERGPLYHYANFTAKQYEELEAAESKGSYFIRHVKKNPGAHPYTRVDEPKETDE